MRFETDNSDDMMHAESWPRARDENIAFFLFLALGSKEARF